MVRLVAVIDLGKTNTKVALVDTRTACEVEVITQPAATLYNSYYPSLDHESIEKFLVRALSQLSSVHNIDALTVTTHGATVALIDEEGGLALPVIDYECEAIDDTRAQYDKLRPSFSLTGSPSLPGGLNIGAQLYWQQTLFPKEFEKVKTVLTWPQYWVYRLTGQIHNDASSLGCHSDLYEPRKQQYSELVEKMGWGKLFPATKLSGSMSGFLTSRMAELTQLPVSTPVHCGIHDSNASLVPHLFGQTKPASVISTGTWFIVMSLGGAAVAMDEHRDTLLNVSAFGDCVPSARFMGGRERELLGVKTPGTEKIVDELLRSPKPTFLLPAIVSGTGPYPNSMTRWVGSEIPMAGSAASGCVVALYLALMTYECMKLVGCDGPTFVEGPLAHDVYFGQMLAALNKHPVFTSESETGTSVGAAMLVKQPETLPQYQEVLIDAKRRLELKQYAAQWTEKLSIHSM